MNLLLPEVVSAVRETSDRLLALYAPDARPSSRADIRAAAARLEDASQLRTALTKLRPGAAWIEDEHERAPLTEGEWWAVDDVEGAVNHIHGRPSWCVSVTLVRDGVPVLTVVHQPIGDRLFTAVRGGGAHRNGVPLRVSAKAELDAAIAETSQVGDEPAALQERIGAAVALMMGRALLVRTTIPTTFPMLALAEGRSDVFWQYEPALTGVAAGVLLATEAGAVATDLRGEPWRPGRSGLLLTNPALRATALEALAAVR